MRLAPVVGRQQRHNLEELGRIDLPKSVMVRERSPASVPVVTEVEVVCGVGRGQQLEDRQRHTAGVDLLEDLAHSFLRRRARQLDRGDLVVIERLDDRGVELHPGLHAGGLVLAICGHVRVLPHHRFAGVEHDVEREHLVRDLEFARGQVPGRLATERPDDAVGGHPDDRLLTIGRRVQAHPHVRVVPAQEVLALRVTRRDWVLRHQREVQRRRALLPVEEKELRLYGTWERHSFEEARPKPDVRVPGLERHHRTNRIRQRDRRQQARDVVVVPHPAPLEVRELEFARAGTREQLLEWDLVARELLVHRISLPLRVSICPDHPALDLGESIRRHSDSHRMSLACRCGSAPPGAIGELARAGAAAEIRHRPDEAVGVWPGSPAGAFSTYRRQRLSPRRRSRRRRTTCSRPGRCAASPTLVALSARSAGCCVPEARFTSWSTAARPTETSRAGRTG